jgi:membrane associated rhomboid family serine protease
MEIDDYISENQAAQPSTTTVIEQGSGWPGVIVYTIVLLLMFVLQHQGILGVEWFDAGRANAALIRQGEWWRTVTALSLHSDLIHLVSNIVFGGMIGFFAGKMLGSGLAWFSILLAGAAGNMLNALIRDPRHTSIGASTAVFAAFGMVAAFASVRRRHLRVSKLARYAPIVGAVVLLSYLGTSGERTDVFAHVAGFVAGLLFGALYGNLGDKIIMGIRTQILLGIGAVALLGLTWLIALTQHKP